MRYFKLVIAALWVGLIVALWHGDPNPQVSATPTLAPSSTPTATVTRTRTPTPTRTPNPMVRWAWEGFYRDEQGDLFSYGQATDLWENQPKPICPDPHPLNKSWVLYSCDVFLVSIATPTPYPTPQP